MSCSLSEPSGLLLQRVTLWVGDVGDPLFVAREFKKVEGSSVHVRDELMRSRVIANQFTPQLTSNDEDLRVTGIAYGTRESTGPLDS